MDHKGAMVLKILLEIKVIVGKRGERGERGEKGLQGDISDVLLSVLADHLPIQLATRYGEKMCFVKYHISEDRSSIVDSSGGVQNAT